MQIDSFITRMPLADTNIIDPELRELISAGSAKRIYRDSPNGYEVIFQVKKVTIRNKAEPYLIIRCTSKILCDSYFEGITSANIQLIYKRIQALNIAKFPFETFMASHLTDVDFKRDIIMTSDEYKKLVDIVDQLAIPSIYFGHGMSIFDDKDNRGRQFSSRKNATPNCPYIKLYNKYIELIKKSKDFATLYLSDLIDPNLYRVEFTLKDRKHFAKYGITDTSLSNILSLSDQKLMFILNDIWSLHMYCQPKKITLPRSSNDRYNTLEMYRSLIPYMLNLGGNRIGITRACLQNINRPNTKTSHLKMVNFVFDELEQSNHKLIDKDMNDLMRRVGMIP